MTNHMIIGLGGTGGKIIRALRRSIFQEHGSNNPPNVNIEYLYMDSSDAMMKDDLTWKVLGKSVGLNETQKLLIGGGVDLRSVLNNISKYPCIGPWIGGPEQWLSILGSVKETEIQGGQKRRLGRFLFACNARAFDERIVNLYNHLKEKGETDVTFHVCCGLAGGTGSGTIIDVVSQLRYKFGTGPSGYKILVYALLPEEHPRPNWDKGNYHANGYAALMELNALSVGAWKPYDVVGGNGRLDIGDPFVGCYLFYNQNEKGQSMDIQESIPNLVANFLYYKLVVVPQTGSVKDGLKRMEDGENLPNKAETDIATGKIPERSKRFLAFGIKRLSVPNEEIKEFMTYHFARQATLQMLYGHWTEGGGYIDEAKKDLTSSVEVRKKDVLRRWKLSDEHICLSEEIISSDEKWKPIQQEWKEHISYSKELAQKQDKKGWLKNLSESCTKKFENTFRKQGVISFYAARESSMKEHIKEIDRIISGELFEKWKDGEYSLHQVSCLVDALLNLVVETQRKTDDEIAKCKQTIERCDKDIKANWQEFDKVGIFDFGKRNSLLDIHASKLENKYIAQTYQRAWEFAKPLLGGIKLKLQEGLRTDIINLMSLLSEGAKDFHDRIKERCNDSDLDNFAKPVMRFYKPSEVHEFTERLIRDKDLQRDQSRQVRLTLIGPPSESPSFNTFIGRISRQSFRDKVESTCKDWAITGHNNLANVRKERPSQIDVNIMEKLDREYGGDTGRLTEFIKNIIEKAGNYLRFNKGEEIHSDKRESYFAAIIPKAEGRETFSSDLKNVITGNQTIGSAECSELDSRPHEIVFISVATAFPLRYVEQVKFLKRKYDECISKSDNPERTRLELHCESEGGEVRYPKLFPPTESELRKDSTPYVLLGAAMGLFSRYKSPSTGIEEYALILKDEDGMSMDPIRLGKTLTQLPDKLDMMTSETVRVEIMKKLSSDYRHIDKQEELKKGVVKLVEEIKAEQGGDLDAPIFKQFRDAGRKAIELIKSQV